MELFAVFVFLLYASQDSLTVEVEVQEAAASVELPCHYSKELEEIVTVKWSRLDLDPNTVHRRREGDDLHEQNQLFRGRTSIRSDALDSGDFTLTLTEPQRPDSGNYTCSIIDDEGETMLSDVQLYVKEIPTWTIVLPPILVLLALGISGGLFLYFRQYFMSEISTQTRFILLLVVLLTVTAVSVGLLFHFRHYFKSEIPAWSLVLLLLLFFLIIDVGLFLHFRQQFFPGILIHTRIILVLKALLVLLGPAVSVGLLFIIWSELYSNWFLVILVILALLAVLTFSGDVLFHIQEYLSPEIYLIWSIIIILLLILTFPMLVTGGRFVHFREHFMSDIIPKWEKIASVGGIVLFLLIVLGYYINFVHNFRKSMSSERPTWTIVLLLLLVLLVPTICAGLCLNFLQQLISETPSWARIFLIVLILLVLTLYVGLLFHFRQQFMSVYKVDVDSGVKSVLLPFKTNLRLLEDFTVTWTDSTGSIIHKYPGKSINPLLIEGRQYQDRTEMKNNFKYGDLSLILKNPTNKDTGTYTCTYTCTKNTICPFFCNFAFLNRWSGEIQIKKQVLLNVRGKADSLIMAIDFGSGYSGYTFNLKPREEGGETQLNRWGKELGLDSPKTPTCILFDEYKQFLEFGYEAKTAYSNMTEQDAEKYYFVEDFKMTHRGIDLSKQTIEAANGKSMTRLEVFTEVLRFLKDDALKTIKHHPAGGEISASDFTWVLTLPDSFGDNEKDFVKEAAILAGLVGEDTKDKLVFALESAAALAWCLKPPPDGFITQNHSRTSQDQPPEPAGAGTSCNVHLLRLV
ncbi:uncharacterized protein LOC105922636 isoform X2 [Fundulus heteroclitus]|uniref:uncharacterized protein LOC105922636 isoform X2 n=1 Tax=Fundulus heteroclitus TaxID=8078 RepID=UPI00165BE7D9|nr:uncharacterized protein LOC105922636 isoform X2 [Fundulus heteroclitus]